MSVFTRPRSPSAARSPELRFDQYSRECQAGGGGERDSLRSEGAAAPGWGDRGAEAILFVALAEEERHSVASVDSTLVSDALEITPETVAAAADAARAAIAAAADSASLKQARAAHVGEGSPLARLNASLRDVAPERKAEFGKLIGQARGQVTQALAAREAELEAAMSCAQAIDFARRAISEVGRWLNYVTRGRFLTMAADLSNSINVEGSHFFGHYDPVDNPGGTRLKAPIQEAVNASTIIGLLTQTASADPSSSPSLEKIAR